MSIRAAIYCRISRDEAGTGLGVQRQQDDCRALVERLGWDLAEVFIDNDLSAFSGRPRPEYRRMLTAIEAGDIGAVTAWHPDRLHRSPTELEHFIDLVERHRVKVSTCQAGEYDLAGAAGRMTARVVGAVARHESEQKSERIRRKHAELAAAGKVSGGGRRPFGYDRDRVTVRADEADVIRHAAAAVLAGSSVRSVVTDWTVRGVRTVTGAHWSPTTVKRLLRSGRIAGQREHHGEIVGPGVWPAIIDPATSTRLRAVLSHPDRRPGGTTARSYLLTGFLFCGRCEAKMTTRPTGNHTPRYVCAADRGGCGRCGIGAAPLEALLSEAVVLRFDTPDLASKVADRSATAETPDREIADVERQLDELAGMWAAGDLTRSEWQRARQTLLARLDMLQGTLVVTVRAAALPTEAGVLRAAWPTMDLDARRAVLAAALNRVTVAPTVRSNNRFDPSRVTVEWRS